MRKDHGAGRRNGFNPSYKFPVWNGLLEPKHRKAIGPALWEFLWCIDKTTKEKNGIGYVYGGKPVTFAEIAEDLGVSEKTIQRHIERLYLAGYIEQIVTPHGQQIRVIKSCKFTKEPSQDRSIAGDVSQTKVSDLVGQNCPTTQDNSVHPPDKSVRPNIREGSLIRYLDKALREGNALACVSVLGSNSKFAKPESPNHEQNQPQPLPVSESQPKPPRRVAARPYTEAEIAEQLRALREKYPEQFAGEVQAAVSA